jgi:putative PIN family toxin of toxin-antitoxin system
MSCSTRAGRSRVPERVVFDTNIWISGLLWRGKPYQCLLLARGKAVQHVHCTEMMAELSEKLRETFGFSENRIRALLYDVRRVSERVEITGEIQAVADDPDDDKFIECASVAGASAVVSGDHHLLELGSYKGIPILSAAEFLTRIA